MNLAQSHIGYVCATDICEMTIVTTIVHVTNVVVSIPSVAKPSSLAEMEASGIIQRRPRLKLPANIVEELCIRTSITYL